MIWVESLTHLWTHMCKYSQLLNVEIAPNYTLCSLSRIQPSHWSQKKANKRHYIHMSILTLVHKQTTAYYLLWNSCIIILLLLLLLSRFSHVRLCATPQMAAHQASPSMGFSRQEYWSGLPLPSLHPRSLQRNALRIYLTIPYLMNKLIIHAHDDGLTNYNTQ